jgi:hypothetical protein
MTFLVVAENFGRTIGRFRPRLHLLEWLGILLLAVNSLGLAAFIWMYRYDISGPGLVLDRLSQTVYTCYNGTQIGGRSHCSPLYPPRYTYSLDGVRQP